MKSFLFVLLAFSPLILFLSVYLTIDRKRYEEGTRAEDRLITKTRLLSVNGVETVTRRGAVAKAVIGHMLAGDLGLLVGAMSAQQVRRDNEFTFLVYYSKEKKGNKTEVEKVLQSSGRFRFLVSRLETEAPTEKPEKPNGAR